MFVTNIRYGELPVRKLYLGEKLVWQCVDICGDAESSSFTKAYMYIPVLKEIIGESISASNDNVSLHSLELEVMNGKSESLSHDNATMNLLEILLASGISVSKTMNSSVINMFEAELLNGSLNVATNDTAVYRVSISDAILSNLKIMSDGESSVRSNQVKNIFGYNITNFEANGISFSVSVKGIESSAISHFASGAVASCWIPVNINAVAESFSKLSSDMRIVDVMLLSGNTEVRDSAEAMCRLFDLFRVVGDAKSNFDTKVLMTLNPPVMLNGESQSVFIGNSFINKYFVLVCSTSSKISNYGSAAITIVYPPIGDGVVLTEGEIEDITVNGNILEIRQAYQVNIDKENGILEVI